MKKIYVISSFIIIILVLVLSVGFSAFNNKLLIDANLLVKIDKDIRILNVGLNSVNESVSNSLEFNISSIMGNITLSSNDSYVIYDVDLYNLGNVIMGISDVNINQDNLKVELLDYNLKDKICNNDRCSLGVNKKIRVKISYKDGVFDSNNTVYQFKLNFIFGMFYNVTYKNVDNSDNLVKEVIENDNLKVNIVKNNNDYLKVTMGNKILKSESDYTYIDGILNIFNVSGNIVISLNENSLMKNKIIESMVSSKNEDDITYINFDELTDKERSDMFSNVATDGNIIKVGGITGNDVLFFRGNIENNYVSFGGYLWRIMEIDENGNLRIILNDAIGRSSYNSTSTIENGNDAINVLSFKNSVVKTYLNNWYSYLNKVSERIVPSKFCNDFSYVQKTSSGSGNVTYYFQSYQNVGSDLGNYKPSLYCSSNYIFEENIGLISAEEYVLAGGAFEKENTSFYLYNSNIFDNSDKYLYSNYYWTLSPAFFDTTRKNGDMFISDSSGKLKDWTKELLEGSYLVKPVITISGDYEMEGTGSKDNPYKYGDLSKTGSRVNITNLEELNNNTYFIGHINGKKKIDGLMSDIVSTKLNSVGLLGKDTAIFSDDKNSIINNKAITFTFLNGEKTSDGYYYYLMTDNNTYLKINDDYSIELSNEPVKLKVSLSTINGRSGQIYIANENNNMYLNFYGGASNEGDDKFAAWNEIDDNVSLTLYKLN